MEVEHEAFSLPFPTILENVDVEAVSSLLSKEMSQLSLREQYGINKDVKGMNILASTEPSELVSLGLNALDTQLETVDDNRYYYRLAQKLGSKMVQEKEFRLKFARAEQFDPVKAATRIENYLKIVKKNFGDEFLTRTITLSDLDKVCDTFNCRICFVNFEYALLGKILTNFDFEQIGGTGSFEIWVHSGIAIPRLGGKKNNSCSWKVRDHSSYSKK